VSRRRHLAVLVAAIALLSGACGQSNPSTSPAGPTVSSAPSSVPASTSPTPGPSGSPAAAAVSLYASSYRPEPGRPGGEVVVGDWRAPTNLNPYLSNDPVDSELFGATMRSLLRLTSDGHWAPDLAAAPIDGRNVTRDKIGSGFSVRVQLRPGLRWSDGQPLTMDDFKFTRQWVLDPKQTAVNSLDWGHVDRIEIGASHLTAIYHFADAFTDWLSVIGRNPPLPAHYMAGFPAGSSANAYPIGDAIAQAPVSGPYRYAAASTDAIVLERNEDWHAGHPPYLDRITFRSTGQNKDQLEAAVSTGTVAVGLDFTADDLSVLDGMPTDRVRVAIVPTWSYEHLDLNTSGAGAGSGHPALADGKLRAAIAGAIDRVAAYQAAYPVTPGSAGRACTNAPSNSYWSLPNADAHCPKVDVAAANAALDAAGYRPGSDGIRTDPKTGAPLRLRLCAGTDTAHRMVGQFLADGLRRVGGGGGPT
jgi:peptide/nickel transport system substrate-binding protein